MRHHTYTNIKGFATVSDSKSGGEFASALERDRFTSLVPRPEILSVELQRPQINYVGISGETTRYTGDMLVRFKLSTRRRPLVIETKYAEELQASPKDEPGVRKKKAELNQKHELLRSVFAEKGMDFEVHTEAEVYTDETRMQRFVFGFINNPFDDRESEILNKISEVKECAISDLIASLRPNDEIEQLYLVPSVWKLVARHYVRTDFSVLLNGHAIIRHAP